MAAPIQIPANCDVRSVIRFLNAKGERPEDIQKQIVAVYGNVMNRQNMSKANTAELCNFVEAHHNWRYCMDLGNPPQLVGNASNLVVRGKVSLTINIVLSERVANFSAVMVLTCSYGVNQRKSIL